MSFHLARRAQDGAGRAFDTISKILFVKMYVERSGLHGTFSVDYLDRRGAIRLPTDPLVHDGLFDQTKNYYKADELFIANDRLEISEDTFRRIVKELERFDLSKTGDDIKGLAFERFLGNTFRGELGQFFTPRPLVDFMVNLLDPQEGEFDLRSRGWVRRVPHSRIRACARSNWSSGAGRERTRHERKSKPRV